ncbi:serine carboxypeptidase-like 13 isoform X3 [Oryza sativa Japonica Group]|uniref:serine carboxypeptidase-like 13 isoform X3 n=1 Tax=Oryza sativa subsp. japonica TaxID=39947 RepID=UPI0007755674|nr:serine carboxypeptidase-like 13 isoform X4 [Oryza sativa Japonica Group]
MGKEASAMVARRSTSRRDWRRWWWWLLPLACCFVCWVASSAATVAPAAGVAVTSLPGFDGPLPFSLETGYVEVNESTGVRLFYYFVQSEKDPDVDPLLLWLSGGPGCSSLSGLTHEIGPFQFAAKRYYSGGLPKIIYQPETWTKVSNIIFVDSPVGAGFSYAATQEGSKTSDTKTVKQLVIFLRKWLHDHPQFLLNPLYIGGDSYSGYIVPTLALAIDEISEYISVNNTISHMGNGDHHISITITTITSNDSGDKPILNLMGYVAGNPRTERQFDEGGKIPFLHGMGLISNELYECTKDINMLHVLEPFCEDVGSPGIHNNEATDGMIRLMLESASAANDDIIEFKCRKASYVVLQIWANDKTVRESLGVHKGTVGEWIRCNFDVDYIADVYSTVEYHLTLMRKGYRALIYSGDHDCQVPFTGTQAWIRFLNLSVIDDWRPWYAAGQVAGFTRSYANNNLIYATVKGAGHTAPEYKPKECLEMFARWISGNTL